MKDKKIIKIIKQKADDKNIPDVSMMIKEKINILNQTEQVKQRFNFKAIYASFAFVLTASIIVMMSLFSRTSTDLFDDNTFSDQVVLSLMSTVDRVEMDSNLSFSSSVQLLSTDSSDDYIEDQIDEVLKYTEFMETYLNNTDAYDSEIKRANYLGFNKLITYYFKDMSEGVHQIDFYYRQNINQKESSYQIEGLFIKNEQAYDVVIEGILDASDFSITYHINDMEKIISQFKKIGEQQEITLKRYQQDTVIEESMIAFNNREKVTLTFVQGKAKGIYEFTMDQLPDQAKMMRVQYQIGASDDGVIEIRINQDELRQYILDIIPNGRPPFVEEKDRPTPPGHEHRPNHPRNN